jgi:aryl-alcohol dehydrogenase-like predicted oxidoreductase
MSLPESSRLQLTPDLNICRILNGMWQVSGAHGPIHPPQAIASMFAYVDAGFTTWDLADHYGPAEDFIGEFRRQFAEQRGEAALDTLQAFTKWVPRPGKMTRQGVEKNIEISRKRMGVESLDLLQFHWWDYQDLNYLDALKYLTELQEEGKIKHLALTNFDTEHLAIIVENGIKIVSNQVQFSVLDRRPEQKMVQFCLDHGIQLLAYGTLAGGLLSERYLGQAEPHPSILNTASLKKYKNMQAAWGSWNLFQELLQTLQEIGEHYHGTIANVAVRYVLDNPAVAGAIVGTRLGVAEHIQTNTKVFEFQLTPGDIQKIDAVSDRARNLGELIGDCGDEYRRR